MLHKIRLVPGLDKQSSDTGAEGKWVNADYTRFRYGFPEKVGGWEQLVNDNLIGAGRDQHTWVDLAGNKYAAIGTNKCLYIYFEGAFYDITPLDATRQQTGTTFYFCWYHLGYSYNIHGPRSRSWRYYSSGYCYRSYRSRHRFYRRRF